MQTEEIRNFANQIIGYIVTESDGTQIAKNWARQNLGYYYPNKNETRNWARQIIAKGNVLSALIWEDYNKTNNK